MHRLELSSTRRLLLWFFDEPSNDPYVSLTFDVETGPMRTFLDAFARETGERIGVQHVVTKAVARCLSEVPALNVKVLRGALYQLDCVDIAMPVHLAAGAKGGDETGMTLVHDVDRKTLLEVARETRRNADDERNGKASISGSAVARLAMRYLPDRVMRRALDGGSWLLGQPTTYRLAEKSLCVSSVVTNVGAVFRMPKGARFRAASATIPSKLGHVSTVFGIAPTEHAAVVDDGVIVARQVLPILMVVDHRAVDGVLMATAASRVAAALLEPAGLVDGR